jgi:predicted hydrolase (HD superfamily)
MKTTITAEEANGLLRKYLHQDYLLNHSRETEVIMRSLARHFGEDEEFWGLTGLLHDLDLEQTVNDLEKHGERTCAIMEEEGYSIPVMFHAIKAHSENLGFLGVKRESKMEYCLAAAENVTGLIVAYVLMRPDKKIEGATASSLTKKFKDKSFAAKVNREFINDIEKTDLQRNEFFEIALSAMKGIAPEIGL